MSAQTSIECTSTAMVVPPSSATQMERFDQLIQEAETRLLEREAYVREASLVSGDTAVASFELEKMRLLIALLYEGRQRLATDCAG